MRVTQEGIYRVTGIAWSVRAASDVLRSVQMADKPGRCPHESQQLDKALVRFSIPWRWDGAPAVLQSRATDSAGSMQPTRDAVIAAKGTINRYHNPCIQSWE